MGKRSPSYRHPITSNHSPLHFVIETAHRQRDCLDDSYLSIKMGCLKIRENMGLNMVFPIPSTGKTVGTLITVPLFS